MAFIEIGKETYINSDNVTSINSTKNQDGTVSGSMITLVNGQELYSSIPPGQLVRAIQQKS